MLKMRLQRTGRRGKAYFRLVVTEHTTRPGGRYLELLGSYDPHGKELRAKEDRIKYWAGKGAKFSPTLNNLLINKGVIQGEKVKSWRARPSRKSPVAEPEKPITASASQPVAPQEEAQAESVPDDSSTLGEPKDEPSELKSATPADNSTVDSD
ncbi:MAG: 30S ribosomal protein S16 [Candidatus Yanofskybacteria bacterium CG10_big_fil_rev_8_21_14_0_10_46_23]|uniref:Small ribosomal subunit protein bS16 n=1 Tax=Candidatus Yanofskybacteria bacterium CG10_big_fil_rev_8_21_14_0_10_46_23 TaxID=1975098 RepID=A0A2H0R444_9BACT|nr:MAG: 30S ribosomal protein S16 [Candidatus Yanofskybacteria bacterium CG10_big_fil_rev_8_21_14_0_10_46_23]